MDSAWGSSPNKKVTSSRPETPAVGSKLIQLQRTNSSNGLATASLPTTPVSVSPTSHVGIAPAGSGGSVLVNVAATGLPTVVHPLRVNWVFWFMHRPAGSKIQDYEGAMKKIAAFTSVEDFWAIYSHLRRPCDLPNVSDYHLFKSGVRPVWEDSTNINGGKWIVRLKKGLSSRYWEYLVMAVIGEQFDVGDEICGIVLSIRNSEDILSLWNRSSNEGRINLKIRDTMKRILNLPVDTRMEYKAHNVSINDQSSFRNTDVFR